MSRSSEGDAQGSSSISFQNKNENLHESISYGISVPSKKSGEEWLSDNQLPGGYSRLSAKVKYLCMSPLHPGKTRSKTLSRYEKTIKILGFLEMHRRDELIISIGILGMRGKTWKFNDYCQS